MAGKLGRLTSDPRRYRLTFERYLTTGLPHVPGQQDVDYASKVTLAGGWPMYGNDTIGDCTCAAIGHMIQSWTAYSGTEVTVDTSAVIAMYAAVSGYNPQTGANDNGADMQSVLEYMRQTGIPDTTGKVHKVVAYAALRSAANFWSLAPALSVFGSVYVGINCPASALTQFDDGQPWSYVAGSQNDGGHAICLQRRKPLGSAMGVLGYVTWGRVQPTTFGFHQNYAEEAWVVITEDWLSANGATVTGLNLAQLEADMSGVSLYPIVLSSPR